MRKLRSRLLYFFQFFKNKMYDFHSKRMSWYLSAHVEILEFFIGDKPISFGKSFSHLGHLIKLDLSDDDDIVKRRNDFIGQLNNDLRILRSYTLTFSINYFSLTVRVTTAASYSTSQTRTLTVSELLGAKVYVAYRTCLISRTVVCCLL